MARSGRRPRWVGIVLVGALAVLGIAGVGAVVAPVLLRGGGAIPVGVRDGAIVVELVEMAYLPDEIVVAADAPTRLLLRNGGSLQHDFSIDALRLSPDVRPGEEAAVEFVAPAGRYEVYCTFPGHREAGMIAVLVAEP